MSEKTEDAVIVNGEPSDWKGGPLLDLLSLEGVDLEKKGFAVAINARVVRRDAWRDYKVAPGDRVEIVSMYKGG